MIKQIFAALFLLMFPLSSHAMQVVKAGKQWYNKKRDSLDASLERPIEDIINIIVIGAERVGKSSLILESLKQGELIGSGIGVTKIAKNIVLSDDNKARVQFNFIEITPNKYFFVNQYTAQANVAIVVFDITNPSSLGVCEYLLEKLKRSPIQKLLLLSSKIDLLNEFEIYHKSYIALLLSQRENFFSILPDNITALICDYHLRLNCPQLTVEPGSIEAVVGKYKLPYFETSKNGLNIEQLFLKPYELFKEGLVD